MITGYFRTVDRSHIPALFVRANVMLQGAGAPRWLEFMAVTGAARSCINRHDLELLLAEPANQDLSRQCAAAGTGGDLGYITWEAVLLFEDDRTGVAWQCELDLQNIWSHPAGIRPENGGMGATPSILGRDFLALCKINIHSPSERFVLEPQALDSIYLMPRHDGPEDEEAAPEGAEPCTG